MKLLLFLGILYVFYLQLIRFKVDFYEISLDSWLALCLSIILVPFNWWLEYRKWRATLHVVEVGATSLEARHSFLAGIVTGMLTPNMLGNFIGRLFYFQRRHRASITILTLYTNYAQFAASMLFGFVSLVLLNTTPLGSPPHHIIWWFGIFLVPIVLGLFYFDALFKLFFPSRMRLYNRMKGLQSRSHFHWRITVLSLFRHMVFTTQLALTLTAFGAKVGMTEILWIWQYYFWVTLAPSIFLGKIVIRDSVALWVLALAFISSETIVVSSLTIWVMNLLIPTLISLFIVRQKS